MGKTLALIIAAVFVTALYLFFSVALIGGNEGATRTYTGTKKFDNIQDAITFQTTISNAAGSYNAKINSIELIVQSPPTVSWTVKMPATKYNLLGDESLPFDYGKQSMTHTASRNINIFSFIFLPLFFVFCMWLLWRKPKDDIQSAS